MRSRRIWDEIIQARTFGRRPERVRLAFRWWALERYAPGNQRPLTEEEEQIVRRDREFRGYLEEHLPDCWEGWKLAAGLEILRLAMDKDLDMDPPEELPACLLSDKEQRVVRAVRARRILDGLRAAGEYPS